MICFTLLTLFYFLPTIVASQRGHSVGLIALLNLLLGWTGLGWIALMLWAVLSQPPLYYSPAQAYNTEGYRWRW